MFSFFKYSNYRIRFRKTHHTVDWEKWYEMNDNYYISRLVSLKNKYKFEITSVRINDSICVDKSFICIRCKRHEHILIFSDFVDLCNGEIKEVSYSY